MAIAFLSATRTPKPCTCQQGGKQDVKVANEPGKPQKAICQGHMTITWHVFSDHVAICSSMGEVPNSSQIAGQNNRLERVQRAWD